MKIIFICGSLEPGYDGVGDYTRRLAGEIIREGNQASIISLHDKFLKENIIENYQQVEYTEIKTLRLSINLPWEDKILPVVSFINKERPEWVSLQYVPYGFNRKGIPLNLAKLLKKIDVKVNWHIMFHEIWIGIEENTKLKSRVYGKIQQLVANKIIRELNPVFINTNCRLYQYKLQRLGYQSTILPLFSNIPLSNISLKSREETTKYIAIFGGIHPGAPVEKFILDLKNFTFEKGNRFHIIFIGKNGQEQNTWVSLFKKNDIQITIIGEQSTDVVSESLLMCDIGVTTTPELLVEKSGSVAAYREHNLPVLCVSKKWNVKLSEKVPLPTGVFSYNTHGLTIFNWNRIIANNSTNLRTVASSFLSTLKSVE